MGKDWCQAYGYDCTDHFEHWPFEKANFCCIVQGIGCPLIQQAEYSRSWHAAYRRKAGAVWLPATAFFVGFLALLAPTLHAFYRCHHARLASRSAWSERQLIL